jgi:hypothetical protein
MREDLLSKQQSYIERDLRSITFRGTMHLRFDQFNVPLFVMIL